jgi:hypothetical protein
MAVQIKEIIIQGTVGQGGQMSKHKLLETINSQISKGATGSGLSEVDKRQLIEECVHAVLKELEYKIAY